MKSLLFMTILFTALPASSRSLIYEVSFPRQNSHYARVAITIPGELIRQDSLLLKVPVWTPGSYKVREFSRNLDAVSAARKKEPCAVVQVNKNTWKIEVGRGKGDLIITYDMYGAEYGVRETYIGSDFIFLHGVSAFAYVEDFVQETIHLKLQAPEGWESHCALPSQHAHEFSCSNYDELVDSPVAIGKFDVGTYLSGGVEHRVVMMGGGNYRMDRICGDFKKISDEQVALFGGKHPSKPVYIHFIQNTDNGGGGLEHANCQTSQVNRFVYSDEKKYRKLLALVSHEYFHLWNVKRIRPLELGPFDYDREVYTDMLWIAEGITSYYDDLILKRAGIHNQEDYFSAIAENINRFENLKGKEYMSLSASSFNAWIKAYMPDENSKNVTVSYYNKGMLVALLLDALIRENTMGRRSLDDVMGALYERYYLGAKRGFSHPEFIALCSELAEQDLQWFFNEYVFGLKALDYTRFCRYYGLQLTNKSDPQKAYLGINVKKDNGRMLVSYVEFDSPAEKAGLSVGDELIALDGWRISDELAVELSRFNPGDRVLVNYSRRGHLNSSTVIPMANPGFDYGIGISDETTEVQSDRLEQWLR